MKNKWKRAGAALLSAAMLTSLVAVGASADGTTTYTNAPTSGTTASSNILTGGTAAAETTVLNLLGISCVSSDAAGIYNGDGQTPTNLVIYGSSYNSAPDPYLWNFYYNLSQYGGGSTFNATTYANWSATPYALIWNNKSGPTGGASAGNTTSVYFGEDDEENAVVCNPIFFYEPDILLGSSYSSYDAGLAEYKTAYNANYNPLVLGGWGTEINGAIVSGTRSDGLPLEYNTFQMCDGIVLLADEITDYMIANDKLGRYTTKTVTETDDEETGVPITVTTYTNTPLDIAEAYRDFNVGLYYYAQQQFAAANGLTKINYCSSLSYDSEEGKYIVSQGTDRLAQYASGLGNDIYDIIVADGSYSEADTSSTSGGTGGPGGAGGPGGPGGAGGPGGGSTGTATPSYYVTEAELIDLLNAPKYGEVENEDGTVSTVVVNANATGVILGSTTSTAIETAGIRNLSKLPNAVYGTTMQSADNGLGLPYTLAFFYGSQDSNLSVYDVTKYWAKNFYHIKDTEVNTVVNTIMIPANGDISTAGCAAATNDYSSNISGKISTGLAYYQAGVTSGSWINVTALDSLIENVVAPTQTSNSNED